MPPKKKNRDVVATDEVATDYKLQQFLEDVQKFTERSKKNNGKQKTRKKPLVDVKQACHKRGLFENGFRSKPFLKENKARLKSNLNDLVKVCSKNVENEEETSSSTSQSVIEGSYEPEKPEADNNNDYNVNPSGNDKAADENERLCASEAPPKDSNSPATIIKDENQLKKIVWEKYCERMKCTSKSLANIFPAVDLLKEVQQRIHLMIYRTFLEHAKSYPTILRRIFSNDDIKRLAQVVVNDKADKSQQTEDIPVSDSANHNAGCAMSSKQDPILSFPHPSENNHDGQKESGNFFDMLPPKKPDSRVNFLELLEDEPDIYSPGVQNGSPECNVTPPPSPLPLHIQQCWAPSTLSTPRKPEIFSPDISELQSSFEKPLISPPEPLALNQVNTIRKRRRKKASPLRFVQNMDTLDSPQLCFPKRKRLAYSPHRL